MPSEYPACQLGYAQVNEQLVVRALQMNHAFIPVSRTLSGTMMGDAYAARVARFLTGQVAGHVEATPATLAR